MSTAAPVSLTVMPSYNMVIALPTADRSRAHGFSGRVSDSGEGRWTAIAAIEEGLPAPVIAAALSSRFDSRDLDRFANQVLSMRKGFGGHDGKPAL